MYLPSGQVCRLQRVKARRQSRSASEESEQTSLMAQSFGFQPALKARVERTRRAKQPLQHRRTRRRVREELLR